LENKNTLDSWKEISAYLGRSVKTCQRLEKELGLPVHRLEDSPRARVFAYPDELDRWIEKTQHSEKKAFRDNTGVKRIFIPFLIVTVVAIAIVGIKLILFKEKDPDLDPKRVIVSTFENRTDNPSYDTIGHMANDWITKGLAQIGSIVVIPSIFITPNQKSIPGEDPILSLAKKIKAGIVIRGAYYLHGDNIQLHAQVIDAREGKLIQALDSERGPVEEFPNLIESLRQRLIGAITIVLVPDFKDFSGIAAPCPSYEAYKEFMEGFQLFFSRQYAESVDYFLRAASFDSDFAGPLTMAGEAYFFLGEYAKSDALVREMDKSYMKLAPYDRHHHDFLKAALKGDNNGIHQARVQMAQITPSFPMTQYVLGADKIRINLPQKAANIIASVDPETIPIVTWSGYWDSLTTAYHMVGDHKQELKAALIGRKKFPDHLSALWYEVRALAALGTIKKVNEGIDESNILPPELYWNPGRIMVLAGQELREHGHQEASLKVLGRAIEWFEIRPKEEAGTEGHRHGLGKALYTAEKWANAQSILEGLHTEFPENVDYLGYLV